MHTSWTAPTIVMLRRALLIFRAVKARYHCPAFSAAYQKGRIVNMVDNYQLPEYKRCAKLCSDATHMLGALQALVEAEHACFRLDQLRVAFLDNLDWKKCRVSAPFDEHGKELFQRYALL